MDDNDERQKEQKKRFKATYKFMGIAMVLAPPGIFLFIRESAILWAECAVIMVFAYYWAVKAYELHLTKIALSKRERILLFSEE